MRGMLIENHLAVNVRDEELVCPADCPRREEEGECEVCDYEEESRHRRLYEQERRWEEKRDREI